MEELNIKVILSSIREGRFGDKPAQWITGLASKFPGFSVELLDLKDYMLPIFAEAISPSDVEGEYRTPEINRWAEKIAEADAFIIVTPEYNFGYPSSLKNNLDYVYKEWNKKPIASVGYGGVGGARAIEQLRLVAIELQMAPIEIAVHIIAPWRLVNDDRSLISGSFDNYLDRAHRMFEELSWWANALKTAREGK